MELINRIVSPRKSRWSDLLHVGLNIAYAVLMLVLVSPDVDLPYMALVLVILSKWRVIAVRPRFWMANMQANFVDFMVGMSIWALMMLSAPHSMWMATILAVMYAMWLLMIKPQSSQRMILVQASIGQFFGFVALFSYAYRLELGQVVTDSSLLTALFSWIIGYISARHALSAFNSEADRTLLALIWGAMTAELGWLLHHWTVAHPIYQVSGVADGKLVMIPQVAIIITLLSFGLTKVYEMLHRTSDKRLVKETRWAVIFVISALFILFLYNIRADLTSL